MLRVRVYQFIKEKASEMRVIAAILLLGKIEIK
jgi:hypothetical protein